MTKKSVTRTYLPNSEHCFVCGEKNPAGLRTRFYVEDGVVKTDLRPQSHHCGFTNVLHGGVIAAVLDERMGWAAARAIGRMCITADLGVRYLKKVPADQVMTVCSQVVRANRRMSHVEGCIVDENGEAYVRAEGRFLPLSVEETLLVDSFLLYRGGEERVFEKLHEPVGQ